MKNKFWLGAIAITILTGILWINSASAATINGNNLYTKYRLPFQHGVSSTMTQGYGQGNHTGSISGYALDFSLTSGTPVLAITDGWACQTSGAGLGTYVVQQAAPFGGSGTDWYFYGHNNSSWISACSSGWTYLYQGQIAASSGCTGTCGGPHVHVALQNPGSTCYCSPPSATAIAFPPLSGANFSGVAGWTNTYVSDSVMAGDSNTLPTPTWDSAIFTRYSAFGGLGFFVPVNNGGGPGAHTWGNGNVQDFKNSSGVLGTIMHETGFGTAWLVFGGMLQTYFANGGATGYWGYPRGAEFTQNGFQRQDFTPGFICWSPGFVAGYAYGTHGNVC